MSVQGLKTIAILFECICGTFGRYFPTEFFTLIAHSLPANTLLANGSLTRYSTMIADAWLADAVVLAGAEISKRGQVVFASCAAPDVNDATRAPCTGWRRWTSG